MNVITVLVNLAAKIIYSACKAAHLTLSYVRAIYSLLLIYIPGVSSSEPSPVVVPISRIAWWFYGLLPGWKPEVG